MQKWSRIGALLFLLGWSSHAAAQEPEPQSLLSCSQNEHCTGGLVCEVGQCTLGLCLYLPILGCSAGKEPEPPPLIGPGETCSTNAACGLSVGCDLNVCVLGTCVHANLLGCSESGLSCSSHADCESASPLGLGLCLDGTCVLSMGAGNGGDGDAVDLLCGADVDCDDGNPCTADVCATALGLCGHVPIPDCSPDASDPKDPEDAGPEDDGGTGGMSSVPGGSGSEANHPQGSGGSGPGLPAFPSEPVPPSESGVDGGDESGGGRAYRGGGCSVGEHGGRGSLLPWLLVGLLAWLGMRRRRTAVATVSMLAVGLVASLTLTSPARAQGFSIDSNSVPVAPEDLLWTERAAIPMDHLSPFVRVMAAYAHEPLVQEDLATGARTVVIESQSALYVSGGLALLDRFHLAAMAPLYIQSGGAAEGEDIGGFSFGNPALEARVTLLDTSAPFELGLAGTVTLPVGDSDQLVADEAVSGHPRVLLAKSWGEGNRSFVALNAGVRFRRASTLGDVDAGHELTLGGGVNWALWGPLAAVVEVGGRTTFDNALSERVTPWGALLGLRWAPASYSLAAGAGPGLNEGVGNPKYRLLATGGVRWRTRTEEPLHEEAEDAWPVEVARAEEKPVVVMKDHCRSDENADPNRCPDLDADGDAVRNGVDACPLEPEDVDGFEDADGCPDPDNDGDGIPDSDDRCPLDAETVNGVEDEDGCPDKVRVQEGMITTLEPIFFETNSTKIQERSEPLLAEIAQVIRSREDLGVVSIEGHTDSRGSEAYNLELSRGRAESVRRFLIDAGVPESRLVARGFGKSRPLVAGDTPAAHAINRRVEFRLSSAPEPLVGQGGT